MYRQRRVMIMTELKGNKLKFAVAYMKSLRPVREIAKDCGISESTAYRWMADPEFKEFINERSLAYWGSIQFQATEKLRECIDIGDTKAICYALDHTLFREDLHPTLPEITINIVKTDEE